MSSIPESALSVVVACALLLLNSETEGGLYNLVRQLLLLVREVAFERCQRMFDGRDGVSGIEVVVESLWCRMKVRRASSRGGHERRLQGVVGTHCVSNATAWS